MSLLTVQEKNHWKDRISSRIDKRIDSLREEQGFMECVEAKARDRALEAAGLFGNQRKVDKLECDRIALEQEADDVREAVDKKKDDIDRRMKPRLDELQDAIEKLRSEVKSLQNKADKKKDLIAEKLQPNLDSLQERIRQVESQKTQVYREMLAKIEKVPLRDIDEEPYEPKWDIDQSISKQQKVEVDKILATSKCGRKILALRAEKENLIDTVWLANSGKQIKELWNHVIDLLDTKQTPLQQDAQALAPVDSE